MFYVKHTGVVELWGRQFEKYHFSLRAIEESVFHVKRWLFFVVGGGRVLGFSFSCWGWMFHVEHGSFSRWENDSASQHIDVCDHFLEVWKSKLHGMLFRFVLCWLPVTE